MRSILIMLPACLMLVACQESSSGAKGAASVEVPGAAGVKLAAESRAVIQPDGFKTPLPAGVVLTQPYKVRMDVAVPFKDGRNGRRTEFAFLQGDAEQAMQSFAESMTAAGFTAEARTNEVGVVRQVFKKASYGAVFARAEVSSAEVLNDPEAKGFLVAAWPAPVQASTADSE